MRRRRMPALLAISFACFVFLAAAASSSSAQKAEKKKVKVRSTSWTNCGSADDPVRIESLDVGPDSIHIPGFVTVSAQVSLDADITAPVKVDIVAKKKMAFAWVEIPCWQQQFGSCKYDDACALSPYQEACPTFFDDHKIPCHCPLSKGSYSVQNLTTKIDLQVPDWLEKGFYRAQVNVFQQNTRLACYEFVSHLS